MPRQYIRVKPLEVKRKPIFVVGPSIAYIPLTRGYFSCVDSEDAENLGKSNWSAKPIRARVYAVGRVNNERMYMHRKITGTYELDIQVDHRIGVGLDNRKANLRVCTRDENQQHRPKNKNNSSGYKGVSKHSTGMYRARIGYNGKELQKGYFRTAEAAAHAYDIAAKELYGEFAVLNFPRVE